MADEDSCGDQSLLSECYTGMWALLTIPGFMIVMTIVIAIFVKLCRSKKTSKIDTDLEKNGSTPNKF